MDNAQPAPGAGTPSESVTFTPTDTTDYNPVSGSVSVTVSKATPTVSAWPTASAISYGQTLTSSTLTGGKASVSGTFAWTTPSISPGQGTSPESVTFTPALSADYNTVSGSVSVDAKVTTPTISVAISGSPSTYGNAVTFTATVSSGDTNPVTFYSGATWLGIAPPSNGTATLTTNSLPGGSNSITATIAAGGSYAANTSGAISQTVNPATPTVSAWPTSSAIPYGQTLGSSSLIGGTASANGTFSWITPSTSPGMGTVSEGVIFTPNNTADYNTVTGTASITVTKATPLISWVAPAPITSGTALSATQLNASSSVAGTFSYSPALGAVLTAGSQVLTVTFTPSTSNSANYNSATASVDLTVNSAGTTWDAGTVTLTVSNSSGVVLSASTNYGAGATPSSVAEGLATSGSNVRVAAINDTLYIEATGTGASTDYSYAMTSTWNSAVFTDPSFQGSPASGSLAGGATTGTGSQTTIYKYSITAYDPVGNITNYSDSVMGTWSTTSSTQSCSTNNNQESGYDCLNRMTTLHNTATTSTSTQYAGTYLCWSYDAFGNRTAQGTQTTPCASPESSVQPTASYNANNQVTWTTVNSAAGGFSYDAAGNVMNDNLNQYLYDGEGRICAVANTPVPGMTTMTGYVYDADGNRVAKGTITSWSCDPTINGLTSAENETEYILGLNGEPVTEMAQDNNGEMQWQRTYVYAAGKLVGTYDPSPNPAYNPANPAGLSPVLPVLSFRLTDWQGTLRATTDSSGVLQGTCTGLPYGDQIACQGNIPDPHHFTGKERDTESGNDYFGARYYSSNMGRFLTPDWAAKSITVPYASFGDPQTLNLYAYAANGPLNRVDADGHAAAMPGPYSTSPSNCPFGEACTEGSGPHLETPQDAEAEQEAMYEAQVQQAFSNTGNDTGSKKSGPGFWSHVGNLLHGHAWNYKMRAEVTSTVVPAVEEPNGYVTAVTDGVGLVTPFAGKVGDRLGKVGALINFANDPTPKSYVENFLPFLFPELGIPLAVYGAADDGSQFVANQVLIPVFTPDALQNGVIDNGNGVSIPNPAMMDGSELEDLPH
jgi:RHS repeat-associated protein